MRKLTHSLVLAVCMSAVSAPMVVAQTQPDNTKVNKRDRAKDQPTADQQKENKPDRQITKEIRQAIVADKSLSTYGHNVKIITQNGMVTLKGPVHTDDEKKTIVSKATDVAGAGKVTDQLTVKGDAKTAKK